jgi:bifunctional enzyme CysN/CysC
LAGIPVPALKGDNILTLSDKTPWYQGPTVMGYLETVEVDHARLERAPFRMPVQWVSRPHADFRGFAGIVTSGTIRAGDRIRVQPSGRDSSVARLIAYEGDLTQAVPGQSVTITLIDEIDVSRGDVISSADESARVADQLEATIVWVSDQPMLPGRPYWLKIGAKTVTATITHPKYRVNVNTLEQLAAKRL